MSDPRAYYNEIDEYAAAWLRDLIAEGMIPHGDVDTRSIRSVCADDLAGYTSCHFFAGLGGWPYALRLAGWPDDRPVWTGSCPCQPFSIAGAGVGFDDERHLWPDWFWLIAQRRPGVIFGEQVESPDARVWLDLVSADLEGCDYACGPVVFPSAGVGAPNIRHRFWWVAERDGPEGRLADAGRAPGCAELQHEPGRSAWWNAAAPDAKRPRARSSDLGLAIPNGIGCESGEAGAGWEARARAGAELCHVFDCALRGLVGTEGIGSQAEPCEPNGGYSPDQSERSGDDGRLGNAGNARLPHPEPSDLHGKIGHNQRGATEQSGGPHHPWRELEWLSCTDGKRRPTQPGIFPLAPRLPGYVGQLRAAGNAINCQAAAEVIRSYMDLAA